MGAEGARALGEALRYNASLKTLNLGCEQKQKRASKTRASTTMNHTVNAIGDQGGTALSRVLEVNTALDTLSLRSVQQSQQNASLLHKIVDKNRQSGW